MPFSSPCLAVINETGISSCIASLKSLSKVIPPWPKPRASGISSTKILKALPLLVKAYKYSSLLVLTLNAKHSCGEGLSVNARLYAESLTRRTKPLPLYPTIYFSTWDFFFALCFFSTPQSGAEPEQVDENVSIVEVIVAKNRNGQVGTVELVFTKNIGRFDDQAYDHEEDDE